MSEKRAEAADRLIGNLYRSASRVAPGGFRRWALRQIRTLIPYDSALWGTGTTKQWRFHTCELIGLPRGYPQALETSRTSNPIAPKIVTNPGTPVAMSDVISDEQFFASDLYKYTFEPFGISRILSTAHVDPRSDLYSLLTLYRRDRDNPFTTEDRQMQRRLTYHLFNAAAHSFFLHLVRIIGERPTQYGAAVVDRQGMFHEVQPRFLDLLDQHFPERGKTLPFAMPPPGEKIMVEGMCVRAEAMGELRCLVAWATGPLDHLTARERQVVDAIAHGLSFKQAARQIDIAPSTVANHLYRIYRKLGVTNRTDLARLVYPDEYDSQTDDNSA